MEEEKKDVVEEVVPVVEEPAPEVPVEEKKDEVKE